MREGIGKWVDSDRTIYQGTFLDMIEQAHLKLISSMDSGNRFRFLDKFLKVISPKAKEKVVKL